MKKENVTKSQILPALFVSVEINTKICQIIKITGVQSMETLQDICKTCGVSFQHQNGLARHKMNNH